MARENRFPKVAGYTVNTGPSNNPARYNADYDYQRNRPHRPHGGHHSSHRPHGHHSSSRKKDPCRCVVM
ncbi:uncharacterized protein RAG0_16063 [Rhynchosporium agropyri]|uniref:Uncharacterized protein n=2 Tax=Rhynchosporium TaxID=38037 RepID=A0A1E1LNN4_9HELO|nr:uncharacterized protein RCO7_14482 [Rhynchosporium commune]CZT12117.1 uncharacterized protein RAG0_16063 [Rhynchosporium agropyri]